MKKIIFLDGDGTLWYPTKTIRNEKPHWIYTDPSTKDDCLPHLSLAPKTKETLEKFIHSGILLVVISANPNKEEAAVAEISERLKYFGLEKYFHNVRSSPGDDPNGKGKVILEEIAKYNLTKEDALMIGDSYNYDYSAAKNVGIDAYWIKNSVCRQPEILPTDMKMINEVSDLIDAIF